MPVRITHGAFTFDDEKVQEIAKNIEVVNNKKSFWGQFCSPDGSNVGDKLTQRRQVLIDPTSAASLNEGDTPRKDQLKVVAWDEDTASFGSYIEYSRQAYKKNRDSILEMARRQLAHNRLYDIESVRSTAWLSTTYTATYATDFWTTLGNVKIQLMKNGAKPVDGAMYGLICVPEVGQSIANEAKAANSILTGTSTGESVIKNGYLGDYAGFHIYVSTDASLYGETGTGENKKAISTLLFFGKTEDGQFPVISRKADEGNIEVISKEIGSAGADDPTDEYGTIASRVDDIGAYLEHPECVIKMTRETTAVAKNIPDAYNPAYNASGTALAGHGPKPAAGNNTKDGIVVAQAS